MIHIVIVSILVILSTLGIYYGFLNNETLLPEAASAQAGPIDELFNIHWIIMAFFYSLIMVFILYSVVVFRKRKGDESDGAYFKGNTRLEIVWTIVPLGIVLFLALQGGKALAEVERRASDAFDVNVYASQWSWRFEYPATGAVSSELALPVNRQVLLKMSSSDVIHSFWVPEFRVKQDILPGGEAFVRYLRITPTEEGFYKILCAELCGTYHNEMRADVIVMSEENFETWLESQSGCDLGSAECGQRWASANGCQGCHSVDGTTRVGPTWLGLYNSEVPLEDGSTVFADEDYLFESITNPTAKIHEGFNPDAMPKTFSELLTEEQINDIIEFIKSLEK